MAMLLVYEQQKLSLHVPLKFTVQLTLINLNETVVWVYSSVRTVLKRAWILGEVLENSLSFCASRWKVLEFLLTLNSVAWKVVLMHFFGCPRQNMNHNSENLKVIYTKCSMFYAIINYQLKTSESLKNVEKLVKQTVQALKNIIIRIDWDCAFLYNLWNYIPSGWSLKIQCGPWRVLEKWLQLLFVWTLYSYNI